MEYNTPLCCVINTLEKTVKELNVLLSAWSRADNAAVQSTAVSLSHLCAAELQPPARRLLQRFCAQVSCSGKGREFQCCKLQLMMGWWGFLQPGAVPEMQMQLWKGLLGDNGKCKFSWMEWWWNARFECSEISSTRAGVREQPPVGNSIS